MAYVINLNPCPKHVGCTRGGLRRRHRVSFRHRNRAGASFLKSSWLVPFVVRRLGVPGVVARCSKIVARLLVKPSAQRAPQPTRTAPALGRRFPKRVSALSMRADPDCLRGGVCA